MQGEALASFLAAGRQQAGVAQQPRLLHSSLQLHSLSTANMLRPEVAKARKARGALPMARVRATTEATLLQASGMAAEAHRLSAFTSVYPPSTTHTAAFTRQYTM